jgi:iron-sulfur cluster protein
LFFRKKEEIRKALANENLQKALERAVSKFYQNFKNSIEDVNWTELKKRAREIKRKSIDNLPELLIKFAQEAYKAGAKVYIAENSKQAIKLVYEIIKERNAKLVVKSKSMVSEEIGLNKYLKKKGIDVIETDLGEWIIQISEDRPSHLTAPVLHRTKEEIADIISNYLNRPVPPEPEKITEVVRTEMREYFIKADIGISGANLGIAESGTLVIVSNEGNVRLATSLPPVHIALISCEKIVETIEEASTLIKVLTRSSTGQKITSYVSFITGPSRTADIEKKLIFGAHGPKELHIIILDNKRLDHIKDSPLKEALYCLKCGACMMVCPVYQVVGGHIFGGPIYPGGIGLLMTAITLSEKASFPNIDLCSDCRKCEDFCPLNIPIGELILELKTKKGADLIEKIGSNFFSQKKILDVLVKFAPKNFMNKLFPIRGEFPFPKRISVKGKKIYLFLGCLVRYAYHDIGKKAAKILSSLGWNVIIPEEQVCCGAPFLHLGEEKISRKLALKNLKSFERHKPDFIITLCPTGNWMLKEKYESFFKRDIGFKILDFNEFLIKFHSKKDLKKYIYKESQKIFYHYPCHYSSISPNRASLKFLKELGFEVMEEEEPITCCGFSGVFSFKYPEISRKIWEKKKNKILSSKSDIVVTNCPGCIFQIERNLKKTNPNIKIFHLSQLFS